MIRFDDIVEKIQGKYSEKDIRQLQKAYIFAARAHKGQIRRSGEPYLSHPLEVTNILADMNLDLTTLVAGLLHDVPEDTDVTIQEIRENFGKEVADLVEGVTKIARVEDATPEETRAETIRKIILAMTDDLRVIFIKLADRWHNLKTLHFLPEDKQKRPRKPWKSMPRLPTGWAWGKYAPNWKTWLFVMWSLMNIFAWSPWSSQS